MTKNIKGFLENLFEYYFLNIIVNVNFFSDLKFNYSCSPCPVSAILKYCFKLPLNKKLKLIGGAMKYFLKNYQAMKYLGLWSPGLQKFF